MSGGEDTVMMIFIIQNCRSIIVLYYAAVLPRTNRHSD